MDEISFDGIDVAELVHGLYHGTAPLGMGILHDQPRLTVEMVRAELADRPSRDGGLYFDYFHGRPLKVTLDTKNKTFRPRLYDRDAGHGAAQAVVDALRAKAVR